MTYSRGSSSDDSADFRESGQRAVIVNSGWIAARGRPGALGAQRDKQMTYLTGRADLFRDGYTDVCQFTLAKNG